MNNSAVNPLINTSLAPHAPYSVSDAALSRVVAMAKELDLQIHIHLHESRDEIIQSMHNYGHRPLARLHALGLVSPRLMAVHMTQLEPEEIELIGSCSPHVVHCPESNLKLSSGISPVGETLVARRDKLRLGYRWGGHE